MESGKNRRLEAENIAERVIKWMRRRPAIAALAATSALFLLFLAMGLILSAFRVAKAGEDRRKNLYVSEMSQAFNFFEEGNVRHARNLVEGQRPAKGESDMRGFEWRLLAGLSRPQEVFTLLSSSAVWSLAVAPRSPFMAIGTGHGGHVILWNYEQRTEVTRMSGLGSGSLQDCVVFSPSGQMLASTHRQEKRVKVWDVSTFRERYDLTSFSNAATVNGASFSIDNRFLAIATGEIYADGIPGEIKIFDAATGTFLTNLPGVPSWMYRVSFSLDGSSLVATGGEGTVTLWSTADWSVLGSLKGHRGSVMALACSPDQPIIATGDTAWKRSRNHDDQFQSGG